MLEINRDSALEDFNARIDLYRKKDKNIIFIQHNDLSLKNGTPEWKIDERLHLNKNDLCIQKTHANAFYKTDLLNKLIDKNTKSIEFCGAQTEYCVNATVEFAFGLGFDNFMKKGRTSTENNEFLSAQKTVEYFENNIWNNRFLKIID
ncbi:isochorismatase family protein [Streptococcus iniae]|uniref:isochorismatase family protein n=1 Tax=Streptococcus iniae TaxID=1346 RepID=UPI0034E55902